MTANAKSKTYGDGNPALDAVVVGAVNGDTLAYSLATTAVNISGVGSYPITVTLGTQPELHGDQDRRGADGQPGGGDGDGQRQEQDLRRATRRSMRWWPARSTATRSTTAWRRRR